MISIGGLFEQFFISAVLSKTQIPPYFSRG